ncbi:MAG: peptidylprolyl isomerase [Acidisphaera sp.]|nr:peptidylprolyl isomerase [Acidisphaera sp.]
MRLFRLIATAFLAAAPALPALAQGTGGAQAVAPAPVAPPAGDAGPGVTAAPPTRPDPVVATVNGQQIHMSDVSEAAQALPEEVRGMPPQMLYPLLLDQVVDRQALVLKARQEGLDKDPAVQKQVQRAADMALQNALLARDVGPSITEAAIHARYDTGVAGKPGEEEVEARHILLPTEQQANEVIAQLKSGADFQTLAKKYSTDPAAQQGGDLGFFKKGDMLPEFSAAAFALQPGQFTDKPVHTRYGWHVIQVVTRRQAPAPSYQEAHDSLRQEMIQDGVRKVIAEARSGLTIVKFNPDGSPQRATDSAVPPAVPDDTAGTPAITAPPQAKP